MKHTAALAGLVLATMSMATSLPAHAQDAYPSRAITMVVPYSAGGPPDLMARAIGDHISQALGQPVVVDNRPGANGVLASRSVATAEGDGYTIMIGSTPTHVFNQHMRDLPYHTFDDFTSIALIGYTPTLITVNPALGIDTLEELIERAKAEPGMISFATSGQGTTGHLAAELLQAKTGARLLHIPYDGISQASLDIISGEVNVGFTTVNNMLPYLETGDVKALAVTSTERLSILPDVPAITEIYPGSDIELWYAIFGPAGIPDDIVAKLNAEINVFLADPAFVERWAASATTIGGATPEAFRELFAADLEKWQSIIAEAGLTP